MSTVSSPSSHNPANKSNGSEDISKAVDSANDDLVNNGVEDVKVVKVNMALDLIEKATVDDIVLSEKAHTPYMRVNKKYKKRPLDPSQCSRLVSILGVPISKIHIVHLRKFCSRTRIGRQSNASKKEVVQTIIKAKSNPLDKITPTRPKKITGTLPPGKFKDTSSSDKDTAVSLMTTSKKSKKPTEPNRDKASAESNRTRKKKMFAAIEYTLYVKGSNETTKFIQDQRDRKRSLFNGVMDETKKSKATIKKRLKGHQEWKASRIGDGSGDEESVDSQASILDEILEIDDVISACYEKKVKMEAEMKKQDVAHII